MTDETTSNESENSVEETVNETAEKLMVTIEKIPMSIALAIFVAGMIVGIGVVLMMDDAARKNADKLGENIIELPPVIADPLDVTPKDDDSEA